MYAVFRKDRIMCKPYSQWHIISECIGTSHLGIKWEPYLYANKGKAEVRADKLSRIYRNERLIIRKLSNDELEGITILKLSS